MSYVIDGSLDPVIKWPSTLTGAVFGPDVTDVYEGLREDLIIKRDDLKLDQRGVRYSLDRVGSSPLWQLRIQFTGPEASEDPTVPDYDTTIFEAPINIVWRLTHEFATIDYRQAGRYEEAMDGLTSPHRREFNAFLENLLSGKSVPTPEWIGTDPAFDLLNEMMLRFERGKQNTYLYYPVLTRDASFRKEANYRAKITGFNVTMDSTSLKVLYPEIPLQFQETMPENGLWKVTRNEWEVESSGQGTESLMFTWNEYWDPIDHHLITLPA